MCPRDFGCCFVVGILWGNASLCGGISHLRRLFVDGLLIREGVTVISFQPVVVKGVSITERVFAGTDG